MMNAVYSNDCRYRYRLTLETGKQGGAVMFLMRNPAGRDKTAKHPTRERCIGFAKRWGYGRLYICNLVPLQAPTIAELKASDPEPPDVHDRNIAVILETAEKSEMVVVAYGNDGGADNRAQEIVAELRKVGAKLWHLGLTQKGHPRNPQRLPADTKPYEWLC